MQHCGLARTFGSTFKPISSQRRAFSLTCRRGDHYKTLGVPHNASKAQIKTHFYQLSKKHHPDITNDPKSRDIFHKASEAYAVLSNDRERRAYDRNLSQIAQTSSHPKHHSYHPRAPHTRATRGQGATYAWEYSYRPRGSTGPHSHPQHPHQQRPPGSTSSSSAGKHYEGQDPFLRYHDASPGMGENSHLRNTAKRRADEHEAALDNVRKMSGFTRAIQLIGLIALSTAILGSFSARGH